MAQPDQGSSLQTLVCTACGQEKDPKSPQRLCSCGKVLFAQYDLEKAKETLSTRVLTGRRFDLWRLHEILPVHDPRYRYTLGEGWTPLLKLSNAGTELGLANLFLKDESRNPTGTFKSRGLCTAVSKASELGIRDFVIPTAGNAGAALAAYAARANVKAYVFMPEDTPALIQKEIVALGAKAILVPGLISDAAKEADRAAQEKNLFDVSTLKEPYRAEGKKTMGFEVAEQFQWQLPGVIVYPTGGGTGIVGMWKAFAELEAVGMIGPERPRMVSVQSSGCAPIVKAFHEGKKEAQFWEHAETIAAGLRVPSAIGDYLILNALYESKGTAVMVDEMEIIAAMKGLARLEGIMLSPEAATTYTAASKLKDSGFVDSGESIVLFGTGAGILYPELW
ncbi:MAG: threonine synthase [Candidatus Thorarchaeota archaeon]